MDIYKAIAAIAIMTVACVTVGSTISKSFDAKVRIAELAVEEAKVRGASGCKP